MLALVLALPSGTPGAPSVSDAAALAARGPTQAAPAPDPAVPAARLHQRVGDVYFPNWTTRFGWNAVGERTDTLGGRTAVTVYYGRKGVTIAYTIVRRRRRWPSRRRTASNWDGTELRTLEVNGRQVVTWRRDGDTCVLSGTGVKAAALQRLAAWKVPAGFRLGGQSLTRSAATRWRARCSRVVIVASRTLSAFAASR